ncbi:MAG TPA: hypothetical protein VEH31_28830, partial [Streptosporangiaceae bacterium]|nr:hypothetical protein [Streptosporangiaceae bacterium]
VDAALKRAAARLGIKIAHSTPGRPLLTGQSVLCLTISVTALKAVHLDIFVIVRRVALTGPGRCALLVSHG